MAVQLATTDPLWVIQPKERARYEEQFKSLKPENGVVTGDQAKEFFLQSQLPPAILGQIWALSDTDSDGRMDINEFSIACKLINLKLRGYHIPPSLPPALKNVESQFPQTASPGIPAFNNSILSHAGTPIKTAQTVPVQPVLPNQPLITSKPELVSASVAPLIPVEPIATVAPMVSRPSLTGNATIPQTIGVPMATPQIMPAVQPTNFTVPLQANQGIPAQIMAPVAPQMSTVVSQVPSVTPQVQPIIPMATLPSLSHPPAVMPVPAIPQGIPQVPTNICPVPPVEAVKEVIRAPSIESPVSCVGSPVVEWAVPHQSKLKYTQLFNTTDRARTGFLSGPQARNIMVHTRLPQAVLAQIWTLADADSDGRLSCEEFVLAMHLCDMAKEGRPVPTTLPVELVPPALRRKRGSSFCLSEDKQDVASSLQNSVSFEDKRKENFDKGQAELERRRAVLLEAQRKEQEERERKEREEQEKLEALRAEQEARRQQELQKQLQRQREIEQEQEEQKKRAAEQREAARKELERQRQQEWEKARTQELEAQRMKEQDTVLKLKAKNQSLAIELATLTSKVKELSVRISETRAGVSAVKSTIDGMRVTRDTHMNEMSALKGKLKEQNQRLLLLTQEKARLEARNKVGAVANAAAADQILLAFTNKQITIKHLNEKIVDLQNEVKIKTEDVENNNLQLKDLKTRLGNLVNECETLYSTYADKRDAVLQLKASSNTAGGWGSAARSWGTSAEDSWGGPPDTSNWNSTTTTTTAAPVSDVRKYRALYKFESRNPDELSFQPGDIISVPSNQNAEPGWLAGELRGMTGWFPEAYVEPVDQAQDVTGAADLTTSQGKQHLEGILEVPEVSNEKVGDGLKEQYVAVYRYESTEAGDLSFEQGEAITVIKKDGDWWTGVIGDRMGLFPSNYVQKADSEHPETPPRLSSGDPFKLPIYVHIHILQSLFLLKYSALLSKFPPTRFWEHVIHDAPIEATATVEAGDKLTGDTAAAAIDDESVFTQPSAEENKTEPSKSPLPSASGRETPADFEQNKPVTPDFASIPAAQTKLGKKGEVAMVIAPYQATSSEQLSLQRGQLVCIRKKTTTGWWEGELQAKGKKKQVGWFPASYVKIMASRRLSQTTPDIESEQNIEKVIAMFPYKALNDDELSFEKDDVIVVLAREEAAWWRGELRGSTGLFPSNYVMPLDTSQSVRLDPEEKLRQEAIHELVESERAYANDMTTVRQVFEKPLAKSGLVTREQMGKIFLNWREILKGNHALLKLLDERKRNSANGTIICIGDILSDNLPRMGAYVRFCSCQLSAGALLQELTDSSPAFKELCRQCQRDPRTQGLPLSTFLVKPMQRITKYPLLISKVLEHTPFNHPDRVFLEEALHRAEELCSQVNEGVRENENSERLEWLQSHVSLHGLEEPLIFNSITNSLGPRKFIYYGVLTKIRSGRELVGFLLSDCLILTQPVKPLVNGQFSMDRNTSIGLKLYKKPLLAKDMTAQKGSESEKAFTITTSKGQYGLFAATAGEASQWIKNITAVHKKCDSPENKPHMSRFPRSDDGVSAGRLLVEVVEGYYIESKSCLCEVRLNNQVQYTPPSSPPCKWNSSMQFLVRDVANDVLSVGLLVKYDFRPDDLLDRSEIHVKDLLQQTRTGGPVLRKLALRQLGLAEILFKLDLVLFN